jgi:regulator of PEP synthase PpsR (kinase-PPPase family)
MNVFIVSDATGTTAESVLTSVLVHYKHSRFNITRFPFIRSKEDIDEIIAKARKGRCLVVFTLVSSTLRRYIARKAREKDLPSVDLMGPILKKVGNLMEHTPKLKPGVYKPQGGQMYRLAEAINFTLKHDDGLGLDTIGEADLIILGVSRSGKTPTSIYLSCRNVKVANIPIIKDVELPGEIIRMPVKKVGLRIDLDRLSQLRAERARRMSTAEIPEYSSLSYIMAELDYCERLYSRIPLLPTIDVTHRSVEEISEWITHNVLG